MTYLLLIQSIKVQSNHSKGAKDSHQTFLGYFWDPFLHPFDKSSAQSRLSPAAMKVRSCGARAEKFLRLFSQSFEK